MTHSRPTLGPALLLGLALVVACGGSQGDTPTPDDATPTASPTPSVAPALKEPVPWDNATVYFVITDRFLDGDPANNESYGREADPTGPGTFHGGDLKGLLATMETGYFNRLGVSALWITAPYEQVRGWVPGGSGDFKHYGYHGYYALDYTKVDANMGTPGDLQALVNAAHARGIRLVLDVVMNHPGYATIADLDAFGVDVLLPGYESATLENYYDLIDFESPNFADWWGVDWVRAGLGGGYDPGGSDTLTQGVAFLPDFKTESTETGIGLPPFYAHKGDTRAMANAEYAVRDYLIQWLSDWVRIYGVDGFRCDTAKHVELQAWAELKDAGHDALASWRAANPGSALPDSAYVDPSQPFWMTGEVFPHGVTKDAYFSSGFDSLINFDFQAAAGSALGGDYGAIDGTYASYATQINGDPDFNVLSYLSSHDTSLFFEKYAGRDLDLQRKAGTLLLLTPGAVQIFYGDENARPKGPDVSDSIQSTRSDYVWGANPEVLAHWQILGQFRRRHPAVGAGSHTRLSSSPYTFRRKLGEDVVIVALGGSGSVGLDVSADWEDGALVRDAYSGEEVTVSGGAVVFQNAGTVLLAELAE